MNNTTYIQAKALGNPTLLHVKAIWVPGGSPSCASLHWSVVPREFWPDGWTPPVEFRWQRPDYFPEATNPFKG